MFEYVFVYEITHDFLVKLQNETQLKYFLKLWI